MNKSQTIGVPFSENVSFINFFIYIFWSYSLSSSLSPSRPTLYIHLFSHSFSLLKRKLKSNKNTKVHVRVCVGACTHIHTEKRKETNIEFVCAGQIFLSMQPALGCDYCSQWQRVSLSTIEFIIIILHR